MRPFIEIKHFCRVVTKIARDILSRQRGSDCIVDVNDETKWGMNPFTATRRWYSVNPVFKPSDFLFPCLSLKYAYSFFL